MTCISKALIVGGGIAGLSTAVALAKAGVTCDVVELNEGPPLGAAIGITLRPAEALAELGVYDQCFANAVAFERTTTVLSQFDAAGTLVSPGPILPDWPGSRVGIGIRRPILLEHLADAAEQSGATLRLGETIAAVNDQGQAVEVTFSDGSSSTYDLVVGADGIHSRLRGLVFPDAPKPAYSGQFSIRLMLSGPPLENEGWYSSPVGRIGFYNLPGDITYIPAELVLPDPKWMSDTNVYELFGRLLDSFTAPAIVEIRRRLTPQSQLIARPFEWILVPDRWYRGRVLLVGDAAHATTAHLGMGGGMAIEDAVVLGACITDASSLEIALEAFMTRRLHRVRTVVETSLALSQLEQRKAPRCEAVDMITRAMSTVSAPY